MPFGLDNESGIPMNTVCPVEWGEKHIFSKYVPHEKGREILQFRSDSGSFNQLMSPERTHFRQENFTRLTLGKSVVDQTPVYRDNVILVVPGILRTRRVL